MGPGIIVRKTESGLPITSWFPTRTTMSPERTMPVRSAEPPSIRAFTVTRTKPEGSSSSTNRIPTPFVCPPAHHASRTQISSDAAPNTVQHAKSKDGLRARARDGVENDQKTQPNPGRQGAATYTRLVLLGLVRDRRRPRAALGLLRGRHPRHWLGHEMMSHHGGSRTQGGYTLRQHARAHARALPPARPGSWARRDALSRGGSNTRVKKQPFFFKWTESLE
jgi:hypothetical protein